MVKSVFFGLFLFFFSIGANAQTFSTLYDDSGSFTYDFSKDYSSDYELMHKNKDSYLNHYNQDYIHKKNSFDPFDSWNDFEKNVLSVEPGYTSKKWDYTDYDKLKKLEEKYLANNRSDLADWAYCQRVTPEKNCKTIYLNSYVDYVKANKSTYEMQAKKDFQDIKKQNAKLKDKNLDKWIKCMERNDAKECKDELNALGTKNASSRQIAEKYNSEIRTIENFDKLDPKKTTYETNLKKISENIDVMSRFDTKKKQAEDLDKLKNETKQCGVNNLNSTVGSASLYNGGRLYDSEIKSTMAKRQVKDQDGIGVCFAASGSTAIETHKNKNISYLHLAVMANRESVDGFKFSKVKTQSVENGQNVSKEVIDKGKEYKEGNLTVEGGTVCSALKAAQKQGGVCPQEDSWIEKGMADPSCKEDCVNRQAEVMKLLHEYFGAKSILSDKDREALIAKIKASKAFTSSKNVKSCDNPDVENAFNAFQKIKDLAKNLNLATDCFGDGSLTNSQLMEKFLFPTCTPQKKVKVDDLSCNEAYPGGKQLPPGARKDVLHKELVDSLKKGEPLPIGYCIDKKAARSADCEGGKHAVLLTGMKYEPGKGCMVQIWNSWGGDQKSMEYMPLDEMADRLMAIRKIEKR